jgi:hypothetical protein
MNDKVWAAPRQASCRTKPYLWQQQQQARSGFFFIESRMGLGFWTAGQFIVWLHRDR